MYYSGHHHGGSRMARRTGVRACDEPGYPGDLAQWESVYPAQSAMGCAGQSRHSGVGAVWQNAPTQCGQQSKGCHQHLVNQSADEVPAQREIAVQTVEDWPSIGKPSSCTQSGPKIVTLVSSVVTAKKTDAFKRRRRRALLKVKYPKK